MGDGLVVQREERVNRRPIVSRSVCSRREEGGKPVHGCAGGQQTGRARKETGMTLTF